MSVLRVNHFVFCVIKKPYLFGFSALCLLLLYLGSNTAVQTNGCFCLLKCSLWLDE